MRRFRSTPSWKIGLLAVALVLAAAAPAQAYIGPGAGFAVLSSALVVLTAMLSAIARARVKRVVILGLDGLEPTLLDKYMAEGKLPNFAKLAEQGCYKRLRTVLPPLSPVAWSSFLTGSNPGKHNIFDFLTRDPHTYMPLLSSVHIGPPRRTLKVGKYLIPIGKPDLRLMRKGVPFWKTLGDHGIFSSILRVHLTFPPERFRGVLVSGMCVPDLRGSQGMFSYYTTRHSGNGSSAGDEHIGGEERKRHSVSPGGSAELVCRGRRKHDCAVQGDPQRPPR
jgi:hypothetical protein